MKIFMLTFTWVKKIKTFNNIAWRLLWLLITWTCFG
jgi:hypothetical protein